MICVMIYIGGETRHGKMGVEYTINPKLTFPATDDTSFDGIKNEIYKGLGYCESKYILNIQVRCNVGTSGNRFYQLVPIFEERGWRMIYEMTKAIGTQYHIVELYTEMLPVRTESSVTTEPSMPQHNDHDTNKPDESNDGEKDVERVKDDEHDCAWMDDDDSGHDVPNVTKVIPKQSRKFPLSGRSETHPVSAFNDISAFRTADVTFFGTDKQCDTPLSKDQTFLSKEHLNSAVNEFHINANIEVKFTHSDKSRMIVECKDTRCMWRLYGKALGVGSTWVIRKCQYPHTCSVSAAQTNHAQLTATMVADAIRVDLKKDLTLSITNIRELIRKAYPNVTPLYNKLWRGRELAIAQLFGSWEVSYALLIPMLEAIKSVNPGTKYTLLSDPITREGHRQFKAVAWAFGPCIEAIPHLRDVISVDGSFLSGRYDGQLLIACGYDAENQVIPLAFALVEKDDNDNWGWFMRWLRTEIFGSGKFLCVISDRQNTIKWVFKQPHIGWNEASGECVHRLCSQHVAENLYKACKDQNVVDKFKLMVKKKKPRRFKEGMQAITDACPAAVEYLKKVGKYLEDDSHENPKPEKCFQCMDGGYRWGIMISNGSELLNNAFKLCRRLPVTAIVEETFYKCVKWFVDRKENAERCINEGKLWSARVENLLAKRGRKARVMVATPFGNTNGEYEVLVKDEKVPFRRGEVLIHTYQDFRYKVIVRDQAQPQCECLTPNLTGIPCAHVLAVCRLKNLNENDFVHQLYSLRALADTWSGLFHPYGNQCDWPPYTGPTIIPDRHLIKLGRRRKMDEMHGKGHSHKGKRSMGDSNEAGASPSRMAR
ncbi:uncharacterized protein LOC144571584 [Carex rostrata]